MTFRTKTFKLHALAAAVTMGLVACGGGDDPAPTPPTPMSTLDKVKAFLAQDASLWATAVPSAEQIFARHDSCSLNNGSSREMRIAAFNTSAAAYRKGVKFENVEVLAERSTTNSDGSTRQEVDIRFDEAYADGTRDDAIRTTLISGSSAGTPGCAAPTATDELRWWGNRRLVGFSVGPRNIFYNNVKLADGTATAAPQSLRREIRLSVNDPGLRASYAIVSGPGLASGAWKMLSPKTIRDAPEMQGKPGNQNFLDSDNFRVCLVPNGVGYSAAAADCTGQGVGSDAAGVTVSSPIDSAKLAAADDMFNSWGVSAGAQYSVAVYADDGWKTVNGQAGKTPIATYTTTLGAMPHTLARMAAEPTMAPAIASNSMTVAQMAEAMRGTGGTANLTLRQPRDVAGEALVRISYINAYEHGPKAGATGSWPRVRAFNLSYTEPNANVLSALIPGKPADAGGVTYGELFLNATDRNGRNVASAMAFN